MNGLSSRLVASTSCGRTSPRRSIVLDMMWFLEWSYRMRSGIALPRPSHAVGSNGGEGPDPAPCFEQLIPRLRLRMARRARYRGRYGSLAVQLDDELLLRRDRDARPLRTLQHPAAERLLVDREPRECRTA